MAKGTWTPPGPILGPNEPTGGRGFPRTPGPILGPNEPTGGRGFQRTAQTWTKFFFWIVQIDFGPDLYCPFTFKGFKKLQRWNFLNVESWWNKFCSTHGVQVGTNIMLKSKLCIRTDANFSADTLDAQVAAAYTHFEEGSCGR